MTMRVSSIPTVAVPVITGVVLLVFWGTTLGVAGGVVSIESSAKVISSVLLPAASCTVTVMAYVASGSVFGKTNSQVPSPLSVRFPSPAV